MQQAKAVLKSQKISAKKMRLAANVIRGKSVGSAHRLLEFGDTKSSAIMLKVLESAIANAENNSGLDIDELVVVRVFVDEGPTAKRFRARAKGRGNRILKRSCHITVIVSEEVN